MIVVKADKKYQLEYTCLSDKQKTTRLMFLSSLYLSCKSFSLSVMQAVVVVPFLCT